MRGNKNFIPVLIGTAAVAVIIVCGILFFSRRSETQTEPAAALIQTPAAEPATQLPQAAVPAFDVTPAPVEIPESFFDDALFIGDSMTGMLYSTVLAYGGLGNASIVYANSLGCDAAVKGAMRVQYKGAYREISEVVQLTGAKKLFLLLCANDLALDIEDIIADWHILLDDIREINPDVDIYIQSGTPAYFGIGPVNNENILALNEQLKQLAIDRDCIYVDIARGMVDSEGVMLEEYSHDGYVHFNADGCLVWIQELKDPASYSVPPTETGGET